MRDSKEKAAQPGSEGGATIIDAKNPTTATAHNANGRDTPRPYSTRSWHELMGMDLPALVQMWGWFMLGALGVIFGQGGLGKSRVALNIARNQVLGLSFAGLPTWKEPLRHLFLGSENSIHRLQHDTRKMGKGLSDADLTLLDSHIRLATLEGAEDSHISLASTANEKRWKATLEAWAPDVLWVDPWGDVLDGEANSDEDVRATLATLRRLLRNVNPSGSIVILAHARTGAKNIAQAMGYDAANFGKNSKALHASARSVWNLAPGDESENPPLVCYHAKNNDGPCEKPRALILDPETMLYHADPDFDFDAWQEEVNARANGKGKVRRGPRLTEDEAFAALGDKAATKTEAKQILRDAGATRDEADDLCKRLVVSRKWTEYRPPFQTTATYIGPPAAVARRKAEILDSAQGKIAL